MVIAWGGRGAAARPRRQGGPGAAGDSRRRVSGFVAGLTEAIARWTPKAASPGSSSRRRRLEGKGGHGLSGPVRQTTSRSKGEKGLYARLARIPERAQKAVEERFTALAHHLVSAEFLRETFGRVNRRGAAGIDGETVGAYGRE